MKAPIGSCDQMSRDEPPMASAQEIVVVSGHIIDSLILSKVLDTIIIMGGTLNLEEVNWKNTPGAFSCTNFGSSLFAERPHRHSQCYTTSRRLD